MNTIKSIFLYILLLLCNITIANNTTFFGANYPISDIPDSLSKEANAVVREDIGIFKVLSPAKATFYSKLVVTVFNDKHTYSAIPIHYNRFIKIKNIKAKYYDDSGKLIRKVEKDEIRDMAVDDGISFQVDAKVKVVENQYGSFPYTFEVEYELEFSSLRNYSDWYFQRYNVGVQKSSYTLSIPQKMNPNIKIHNTDVKAREIIEGENKVHTWEMVNLVPIKEESYSPADTKILPYIEIAPDEFEYDGHKGKMTDWNTFGKFLYDLNSGRDEISAEMKIIVKRLTQNAKSNLDKIDALYRYIQQNIRYVSIQIGIGGWQTFDAYYVEKNKYGDCKALSNFMKAMLKEVGIESHLAAITAGDDNDFTPDPAYCNPAFNHMILYIPSEQMWLECTSNDNPTGYLGSFTAGRTALLITSEGGKLMETPPLSYEQNKQTSQTEILVLEDGKAEIKNISRTKGYLHEAYRKINTEFSKEDFKKGFQKASKLPSFVINNLENTISEKQPEAELKYELSVTKYASQSGSRLFVPINLHNPFDDIPPKVEKRTHPIEAFGSGYNETDTIRITFPDTYEVESIPQKQTDIKNELGAFYLNIGKEGNTLVIIRRLEILPVRLPANKYNDFRDFYKKIQLADATKVVLKKKVN